MRQEGDRVEVEGSKCPRCGGRQWYDEQFDAYLCPVDDVWLEPRCSDGSCKYCRNRPTRPGGAPST